MMRRGWMRTREGCEGGVFSRCNRKRRRSGRCGGKGARQVEFYRPAPWSATREKMSQRRSSIFSQPVWETAGSSGQAVGKGQQVFTQSDGHGGRGRGDKLPLRSCALGKTNNISFSFCPATGLTLLSNLSSLISPNISIRNGQLPPTHGAKKQNKTIMKPSGLETAQEITSQMKNNSRPVYLL